MKIYSKAIVSNSDMIKNYRNCRKMADEQGKIFILRNNQPDAVLFSISEYERIAHLLEYVENMSASEIIQITDSIQLKAQENLFPRSSEHDRD